MKKAIFVAFVALAALSAFGADVSILYTNFGPGDTRLTRAIEKFTKDFPSVTVKKMVIDLSDGSTMTMDALLASGKAPNIYMDTLVRSSKYMVPEFAADLKPLIRDIGKYRKGSLDAFTKNGKLLGLPTPASAQGMCINLDIMDEIGYTVPDRWTIADFLKMAELVHQKYQGKKWATGMFAANQSGDYLINNWFFSFGTKYYAPGDYSKTTIANGSGAADTYKFFQTLATKGYIPPGSATLTDDDYAADWAMGRYAATAFFVGWMDGYWKTAMEQGGIDKPFRVAYVPFPRAPGVANVPSYASGAAMVVRKTGTEQDVWAARLVEYLNDAEAQVQLVDIQSNIPNRTDVSATPSDPYTAQIAKIVAAGGIMDVGLTNSKFAATRPVHYPILQKVLTGKITPEAAVKEYEAALNAALK